MTIFLNRPAAPFAERACCSPSPMDSAMNRLLLLALGLLVTTTSSGCYHYCRHKGGCSDWQPGGCGAASSCGAAASPRQARLQHHRPRGRDEMCAEDFADCTECGRRHRRGNDDCGLCDDCVRQSPRDRRMARRGGRRPGRGCDACGVASCSGNCGAELSCGPMGAVSGPVSYGSCGGCNSCSGGFSAAGSEGYISEGGWQPSAMGGAPMYGEMISSPPSSGCSGCAGGGGSSYPQGAMMQGSPMMQGGYVAGGYVQGGYVQGGSFPSGMPVDGSTGWHSATMPSGPVTSGPITSEPLAAPAAGTPVYSAPSSSVPSPGSFPTPAK